MKKELGIIIILLSLLFCLLIKENNLQENIKMIYLEGAKIEAQDDWSWNILDDYIEIIWQKAGYNNLANYFN